ncbi:DedA family protein [Kineococcus rubinsiae]|uniref:DedA family protein n=1 Tax=Kineococcus rubinsiae TaxID=2609562 RepID=UPI0014301DD5|nr:VTT domain-containing protein [Kineococcus rubinsiae]NIZ91554.1 hypothetical protein [Kineococcus rubinsiae]
MLGHLLDPAAAAEGSWLAALAVLLAAVTVGAVLPVVPTGAAVSAMAALAHHRSPEALGSVLVVAAAAAWAGDVVLYALLHRSESGLTRLLERRALAGRASAHVEELGRRLVTHDVRTLLTSRLLPGARVPVMLAAASVDYPVRRFAVADVVPALTWTVAYALLGLLGRSVSDRPLAGVAVALVLGLVASSVVGLVQRLRARRAHASR